MFFTRWCEQRNILELKKLYLEDIDKADLEHGFRTVCFWGYFDVVELLLPYVDTITGTVLQQACETGLSYPVEERDERFLKTIELLLNSGKCADTDSVRPAGSEYFKGQATLLLDEYEFRLDGKIYNENIIK